MKPRQRHEALIAEVAAQVRMRRAKLDITLRELAQRTGLTQGYVFSIEQGERDIGLSSLAALAKGLECSPADLMGLDTLDLRELTPEQRELVFGYVEKLGKAGR